MDARVCLWVCLCHCFQTIFRPVTSLCAGARRYGGVRRVLQRAGVVEKPVAGAVGLGAIPRLWAGQLAHLTGTRRRLPWARHACLAGVGVGVGSPALGGGIAWARGEMLLQHTEASCELVCVRALLRGWGVLYGSVQRNAVDDVCVCVCVCLGCMRTTLHRVSDQRVRRELLYKPYFARI